MVVGLRPYTAKANILLDFHAKTPHLRIPRPAGGAGGISRATLPRRRRSLRGRLRAALRYPLRSFGEVSYSSSNFAAIDLILERETGRPLGDLLREHVFEPYGLSRTTFQSGLEPPADVAHGYALKGGTFPAVESPRDVSLYWIDRAVAADVFDLASFFRQLFQTHPEMVEQGLGVRAYDHAGGTAYGHGGAMAGYTVQLRATRDGERVVVAVANSHSFPVIRAVVSAVQEVF